MGELGALLLGLHCTRYAAGGGGGREHSRESGAHGPCHCSAPTMSLCTSLPT